MKIQVSLIIFIVYCAFIGLAYDMYRANKEISTIGAWKSVLWPFSFSFYIIKDGIIYKINEDILPLICILFTYEYKKSSMYAKIRNSIK